MSRPKVAFVGTGGATKGVAHLGVLQAMEELGLEIDVFVGASAGAIVSSFYAMGIDSDEMLEWLRPSRTKPSSTFHARYLWGLPSLSQFRHPGWLFSGLFSIDGFERFLRQHLPHNDFRQLDRPLFVTATDVDGRGRVVFGRGYTEDVPISEAVAASSCVPLLFRPFRIGDRYYVDGGLVRTLSLDLAVNAGADVIVVSNVYRPQVPQASSIAHQGPIAMARQSLNVVLSEKEKRGIDLIHRLYPQVTVLSISPDLGQYSFTSRRHVQNLLLRGYREAIQVLTAAKRRGVFDMTTTVGHVGSA